MFPEEQSDQLIQSGAIFIDPSTGESVHLLEEGEIILLEGLIELLN